MTVGQFADSPGIATLLIDGHVYTFGTSSDSGPNALVFSTVSRAITLGQSFRTFAEVMDHVSAIAMYVTVMSKTLPTNDTDWQSPVCVQEVNQYPFGETHFSIHTSSGVTEGGLLPKSMSVGDGCSSTTRCSITSQTVETVPNVPNSRTRIGVGEVVALSTNVPARWTIKSGKACLNKVPFEKKGLRACLATPSIEESEVYFLAPYSTDDTVVTATLANGSACSISFTTVQPTGLIFQRVQLPPKNMNYYFFSVVGGDFNIGMTSAAFVTPGDVSFKNILIEEQDDPTPHFDPNYNALFNVNGINAWLVGCDKDQDSTNKILDDAASPKQSYWIFADRNKGNQTRFSLVQTEWSHRFLGDYKYSKKQISALSTSGTWVSTPNASTATLILPSNARDNNDWVFPRVDECEAQVKRQFILVH